MSSKRMNGHDWRRSVIIPVGSECGWWCGWLGLTFELNGVEVNEYAFEFFNRLERVE